MVGARKIYKLIATTFSSCSSDEAVRQGLAKYTEISNLFERPIVFPGLRHPIVALNTPKCKRMSSQAQPLMVSVKCDVGQPAFGCATSAPPTKPLVSFSSEVHIAGGTSEESARLPSESHQKPSDAASISQPNSVRSLLYKAEDLRKDQLVSRVLQLMETKLREAGLNLPIQTYTVTATSIRDGIIEMVPNSSTITDINNQYGSVKAYLEKVAVNNQEPLSVVRSRFAESYAAFTVMMFLLVGCMSWTSDFSQSDRAREIAISRT